MGNSGIFKIANHKYYGHILFISIWLLVNLLQAAFTELANDEAYYWMYSRSLDWGYFDHPPMVGLLVKIGYLLFHNELGVRLIFVLMGGGTLFIIYQLLPKRYNNIPFYYLVVFSIIIVNAHFAGFLALPDIPLVFFSSLFLLFYKKYLEKETLKKAIILGVIAAAMMYSKYHAVLVVFFIVISNLSLFRKRSFYVALLVVALLMVPHLLWHIEHGFPTFRYHLVARSTPYKPFYTVHYIWNQFLITGPLIGIFLLFFAFKKKQEDGFQRALKFLLFGFFIFFFLMSFKGRVEPHWLAVAYIPMIVLAVVEIRKREAMKKIVLVLCYISLPLVLFARLFFMTDFLPHKLGIYTKFHDWDIWAEQIADKAEGRPVVFLNCYQDPSKYTFYTGNFATSISSVYYHETQYGLWNLEDSLQGRDILLVYAQENPDTMHTAVGKIMPYKYIDNFRSFHNSLSVEAYPSELDITSRDSIKVDISIINKRDKEVSFIDNPAMPSYLCYLIYEKGKFINHCKRIKGELPDKISPKGCYDTSVTIPPIKKAGDYELYFSIKTKELEPLHYAGKLSLEVKEKPTDATHD